MTDPLDHTTSYAYDNLDRATRVTLAEPSTGSTLTFMTACGYDDLGLLFLNVTDPNGRITKQGYGRYGQLVKSIDAASVATI